MQRVSGPRPMVNDPKPSVRLLLLYSFSLLLSIAALKAMPSPHPIGPALRFLQKRTPKWCDCPKCTLEGKEGRYIHPSTFRSHEMKKTIDAIRSRISPRGRGAPYARSSRLERNTGTFIVNDFPLFNRSISLIFSGTSAHSLDDGGNDGSGMQLDATSEGRHLSPGPAVTNTGTADPLHHESPSSNPKFCILVRLFLPLLAVQSRPSESCTRMQPFDQRYALFITSIQFPHVILFPASEFHHFDKHTLFEHLLPTTYIFIVSTIDRLPAVTRPERCELHRNY